MFKDKLKENRIRLGYSQEELAHKVFVSRSAIAKWEQGRGLPEEDSLERLAHCFGLSPDDLLTKEDMKDEIQADQADLKKSKRKSLISLIVAAVAIAALAITALCGAFVYRSSDAEIREVQTLAGVENDSDRLISFDFGSRGKIKSTEWKDAECRDEFGQIQANPKALNLREGDQVEIAYFPETNLYHQNRIGASGLNGIQLKSHAFEMKQTLFGLGFSLRGAGPFDPNSPSSSYFRFFEPDPFVEIPSIDTAMRNVYSSSLHLGFRNSVDLEIAFDFTVFKGGRLSFWFSDYANAWHETYFDMIEGDEAVVPASVVDAINSVSFAILGAIPLQTVACGYEYVQYNVVVKRKENPSYYLIKSYDETDQILGTEKVWPSSDLSSLSLADGRAYSLVEEYHGDSLYQTSSKIGKNQTFSLSFANAEGFFDQKESLAIL
jgi:transcriptional regulator with XRE-family HTH domain